jgi:hypothetical protein
MANSNPKQPCGRRHGVDPCSHCKDLKRRDRVAAIRQCAADLRKKAADMLEAAAALDVLADEREREGNDDDSGTKH